MNKKTTPPSKQPEPWQVEDAQRLRSIWNEKQKELKAANAKVFTQASFAESYGLASAAVVWQLLKGHRPLNVKTASAFARGLGVQVEQFSPTLALDVARVAEMGKPALRLLESPRDRKLQWLSEDEAHLLSEYRACAQPEKLAVLDHAAALPKVNTDHRSDQR